MKMPFGREGSTAGPSDAVPTGQASGAAREELAELELKQIQKSENPISVENGTNKKIEAIRPWHNYTIVTLAGSQVIKIFNEDAQPINDFLLPLSGKEVKVDWNIVREKFRKEYVGAAVSQSSDEIAVDKLPFELQACAKKVLGSLNYFQMRAKGITGGIFINDLIVLSDQYVVCTSKEGAFFVYMTKTNKGVVLAPRDWKKINPTDPMPLDLRDAIKKILDENEGYEQINSSYYALITDVGINIFKNDNSQETPVFSEGIPSVERNVATDPLNSNVVYYCQSSNPRSVARLDLSAEPSTWQPIEAEFPNTYESVSNLQIDPTGNFFLFYSKSDLVIVTKDTLDEVKRVPGLTQVNFDSTGRIRAVDKDGYLVIYEPNFEEVAEDLGKRRIAKLAEGIQIGNIFDLKVAQGAKTVEKGEGFEYLDPKREEAQEKLTEALTTVTTPEGVALLRGAFTKFERELRVQNLRPDEIAYIIAGLEEPILLKEREFANENARTVLASVRATLASGLSISSVSEARTLINNVRASDTLLETDLREEVRTVAQELEQASVELFRQRGGEITKDIHGLIERTRVDLEAFTSKSQMDDWLEFRYPQLKAKLALLARDVPLEADEAYKAIMAARTELQAIATEYEEKFKLEYAKVREKASSRTEATVDLLVQDADGLIDRLRARGFTDRKSAEHYLTSSDARKTLEEEIATLAGDNPDLAKELERGLKVRISNALTEIERGALTQVAETGQQMVMFGKTAFPKWEAKVKEKVERTVDPIFDADPHSHGPGVKAGDILGDVAVSIRTTSGAVETVRLYEGWKDENEWRLGLRNYRGGAIPPSYVTSNEFREIKKEYGDWSQGKKSELKKEFEQKRDAVMEVYSRRQKIGERTGKEDGEWKKEYEEKLKDFSDFAAEHHISLLRRIDEIKTEPEVEHTNGFGYVPKWQSHWVMDRQTEDYLEEIAYAFKRQLDLQEGMLNLKGHAGTGKDVLIRMFSALTNRPYFSTDCSKWTTEFELSEDVMLESKDGASQTVKVPSKVLNGITTPGAIVYFNEFNAMPEQAQIFLHALMDESRSLTLKTSSGRTVKALPSVLLVASMNPGYPGTFDPQMATKRRTVSLEIGYPPLTRAPDKADKNPNPLYDSSEALRMARGVDSLADLTYEASLEHNEFAQMWDRYVNGIQNGAPEPTGTQRFDIDTILAIVQFSNNLRESFIKIFEKSRDSRDALPVSQPITGSELRRCAYDLSKMTPEEKATANPESVARELLEKIFLPHIDKKEDQDRIRKTMATWTSRKRVKA